MVLKRVIKPKNQRVKRALEKREPLLHENDKTAIFVKGGRTSENITRILKEFALLKKPLATMFQKKNMTRPFDDPTSMEFFANKSDSSLFCFGSSSKKRPDNIILGRMYDHQILDMFEFGVEKFKSLSEFNNGKMPLGTKPCLVFSGEGFETDNEFSRLKNLLIDFFRGPKVSQIRLSGVEHTYSFFLKDGKLSIRSYKILLKKSGVRIPRIELEEIGPALDLKLRRNKIASDAMYKLARKQPRAAKIKKQKNVEQDGLGSKLGRIHMQTQDFSKLQTRKMKGLKRKSSSTSKEQADTKEEGEENNNESDDNYSEVEMDNEEEKMDEEDMDSADE